MPPSLGDALSTWFEARACKNSGARTMARGNVSNTGLMMARLCYDLLMEKGRDALAAVERHEVTPRWRTWWRPQSTSAA
ncbi:hypothetical protein M5E87_05390 [Flavonifractor plautii]|nr:hypothetical protein M5E87_05390 [Flavonifractor plautii]